MTSENLRYRAIQLAAMYAVVVGLGIALSETVRLYVRSHWLIFALLEALLIVVAVLASRVHRSMVMMSTDESRSQLRRAAWYLLLALIVVVSILAILSTTTDNYLKHFWRWLLFWGAVLLAVALLVRPWTIAVPSRLRSWSIQLATFYVAIVGVLYLINAPVRDFVREHWGYTVSLFGLLLLVAFLARPRGLTPYTEYPEPDELETIRNLANLLIQRLEKQYTGRLTLRDTHPKSNGLLFAEFEVLDLPRELRVGLFAEPNTYRCWMRFSNSEPIVTPDADPDFRGIALKLFDVPGDKLIDDEQGTHDFLFIAHDAFFAANPKDFLNFFVNITHYGSKLGRLLYFFPKRLRLLHNALMGRRSYGHPFEITWFSCAPYLFGERVVKYKLLSEWPASAPDRGNPDYLRDRLTQTLKDRGHTMQLMIQFQEDPNRDLLETTAFPWRVPQFRTVARLHIPPQDFNSQQHLQFDEHLTFNPWHCLPEHRPVGGINRARRDVMRAVQEFRLVRNRAERTDVNAEVPDDAPEAARKQTEIVAPPM